MRTFATLIALILSISLAACGDDLAREGPTCDWSLTIYVLTHDGGAHWFDDGNTVIGSVSYDNTSFKLTACPFSGGQFWLEVYGEATVMSFDTECVEGCLDNIEEGYNRDTWLPQCLPACGYDLVFRNCSVPEDNCGPPFTTDAVSFEDISILKVTLP